VQSLWRLARMRIDEQRWLEEPRGRRVHRFELKPQLTAERRIYFKRLTTTLWLAYRTAPPPIGSFIVISWWSHRCKTKRLMNEPAWRVSSILSCFVGIRHTLLWMRLLDVAVKDYFAELVKLNKEWIFFMVNKNYVVWEAVLRPIFCSTPPSLSLSL